MLISLIQMMVNKTPDENIEKIDTLISKAKAQGGELIVLPEMCCCEYKNSSFAEYAMELDNDFIKNLSCLAKKYEVTLVAGTIPEKSGDKIYNTSLVFDKNGNRIAMHRKAHLFDIDIKNGVSFKESDTFSSGDSFTVFDTEWGKIGLMICYDIRFPEFPINSADDIKLIIVPASFNMSTGPVHWELLFRARALDNQLYMAGCASARDESASYHSWGHSIVTDAWGKVLGQLYEKEGILTLKLDLSYADSVREQLPLLKHRRKDIYN